MIAQIKIRRGTTAEWAAASPVVLAAGEPGWDSTLKGMKVGDGSTEWAALPWIDAKNRPDINADTIDGVHLADIRLGQNLLHNADFRNPVNQRGVSVTISAAGYFFDRWLLNSGSVTIAAGYLTIASGAEIEQRIEGLYLAGETVTVSVKVGTSYISGSGTFPTSAGTASITLTGFGTATLGYNAGYMFVRFTASGSQNVVSVKCELGTVSTLHLDPPMDYTTERLKCLRYCRRYDGYLGRPVEIYTTSARFSLLGEVAMRVNPTISGTFKWYTLSTAEIPVATWAAVRDWSIITINASGATGGQDGFLFASGAILSADL
jgi:hypothetical protein